MSKVTVTNTGECDLVFPSGDTIAVKSAGSVPADDLEHPVVKAWLVEGKLAKGEPAVEEAAEPGNDSDAVKKVAEEAKPKAKAPKGE